MFYGTEACPITSADRHSQEFTINKVLYNIFGAMSKDSYGEICKYFGIDKVEESLRHRQENLLRDILDTVTRYVTRHSLGCDVLNFVFEGDVQGNILHSARSVRQNLIARSQV